MENDNSIQPPGVVDEDPWPELDLLRLHLGGMETYYDFSRNTTVVSIRFELTDKQMTETSRRMLDALGGIEDHKFYLAVECDE